MEWIASTADCRISKPVGQRGMTKQHITDSDKNYLLPPFIFVQHFGIFVCIDLQRNTHANFRAYYVQ